jgi:hypothetical protein
MNNEKWGGCTSNLPVNVTTSEVSVTLALLKYNSDVEEATPSILGAKHLKQVCGM